MERIKKAFWDRTAFVEIIFILLIISYNCYHVYFKHFFITLNEWEIGYLDHVLNIRAFDDVLQGKIFHKDFYWWYGPLYLYIQIPFYYLFGENHYSLYLVQTQILPALGIFISYCYARLFFQSSFLRVLFVLVCMFHFVNNSWASPRHLGAELAIAFFIYSLNCQKESLFSFVAGALASIGILLGFEYGLPAILSICLAILIGVLCGNRIISKKYIINFILGGVIFLAPFFLYLLYHKVFSSYLLYYYDLVTSFRENNPARGHWFPAFPGISFDALSAFIISFFKATISRDFRFYLPVFTYLIASILFVIKFGKEKSIKNLKLFVVTSYGIIVYFRVLSGPAYQYLAYGLIPAITLGFFFLDTIIEKSVNSYRMKKLGEFSGFSFVLILIMVWFFASIENKEIFVFKQGTKPKVDSDSELIYYDKVGFKISNEAYEQYTKINSFIEGHSQVDDVVLVYPWGYYNHFTGRASPLTARDGLFDLMPGEKYVKEAIKELEERKPKLVVLNTHRNFKMVSIGAIRTDINAQVSWRTEDSPSFKGNGSPLELYILENYHLLKKFKYAAVLERNREKRDFLQKFKKTEVIPEYVKNIRINGTETISAGKTIDIKSRKVRINYILSQDFPATHIELKYRVKASFYKRFFTKGSLALGYTDSQGSDFIWVSIDDMTDIGMIKVGMEGIAPPVAEKVKKINTIWVEYNTPKPYFLPETLEILDLKVVLDEKVYQEIF